MKIGDFINVKTGLIGALVMATIIFCINYSQGLWGASTAALKQGIYTFIFGGVVIKLVETLAVKPENKWVGIIISTLIGTICTTSAVFAVHYFIKGTPEPFWSTLPVFLLSPPGFAFLGNQAINGQSK